MHFSVIRMFIVKKAIFSWTFSYDIAFDCTFNAELWPRRFWVESDS